MGALNRVLPPLVEHVAVNIREFDAAFYVCVCVDFVAVLHNSNSGRGTAQHVLKHVMPARPQLFSACYAHHGRHQEAAPLV